jgi:DGQHR domain-containing protein
MSRTQVIRRPAALVRQGQLQLYTTSLRAGDLLAPGFYDIERLDPSNEHDQGFQRVLNQQRAKRLADYLIAGKAERDAFLPTSVFLATDRELPFVAERNELEIDIREVGPFSVVDGQHRLEGLRLAVEEEPELASFEVPVNIAVGLSKIAQMCHFLIVNTTQKSVDRAVEQRLLARLTQMIDVEDVPTLPRWIERVVERGDDALAVQLVDYLNSAPESPWKDRIKMPNQASEEATVNQKSFVTNIKKYVLSASNPLLQYESDVRKKIFLNYWRAISDELETDEETVLFKSIGVDLFCRFSGPFVSRLASEKDFKVSTMRGVLRQALDSVEGEYAGVGHSDWWLSGSGPAGRLNASALARINSELVKGLTAAAVVKDPTF